ncbi:MAG: C39 family peptidase [Defluviitaleaceae bacterium]|nr:C39 family peptidase [Defluviitaleaceae bacterium]
MAVDPATIKLAVQAATKVLTDEETRKKVIAVAVAPLAAFILIVSLFFYILTMPFHWLSDLFGGNDYNTVVEVRAEHGYDQYIDPTDPDWTDSEGASYEGVTFTDGATTVVYYSQLDPRWKDTPYGKTGTIGASGCGPTSLAIAVSTLSGQTVDPVQMANWAYENGYRCEGNGSYLSLIPEGAKHFGLTVDYAGVNDGQKIVDALASGKLVVAIMGPGHFTKSGHFMVLRGVTAEGKILVADPASQSRSEQEWDLSIILNEARKDAGAGGPFWILGRGSSP